MSKEPKICKLELDKRVLEQLTIFNYLGFEVTSTGTLISDVTKQTSKKAKVGEFLYETI